MEVYDKVAHFSMFKQIPEVADGFKREHLNIRIAAVETLDRFEALLARGKDVDQRGLTEIQMEK